FCAHLRTIAGGRTAALLRLIGRVPLVHANQRSLRPFRAQGAGDRDGGPRAGAGGDRADFRTGGGLDRECDLTTSSPWRPADPAGKPTAGSRRVGFGSTARPPRASGFPWSPRRTG